MCKSALKHSLHSTLTLMSQDLTKSINNYKSNIMSKLSALGNLFMFVVLVSISSCNSEDSEPDTLPKIDNSILVDYFTDIGFIKDFSVNANNELYYLHTGNSSGESSISIRKISNNGSITVLDELNHSLIGNQMGITNSDDENIYYVTDSYLTGDKVYRYSIDSSLLSTYSIAPTSSSFIDTTRMSAIESFGDGTYITFDYGVLSLRRYIPNLETDVIIAGSGNSSITDGSGLNAGFQSVTEILSVNEIIYVIDDSNNLRKIEKNGNDFNVTTLISDYAENFSDITVDKKGNILVLVDLKGIYKLNKSNNSLEEYLIGRLKLKDNRSGTIYNKEWGYFEKMVIKKNDLFLYSYQDIIKISDFETKFK